MNVHLLRSDDCEDELYRDVLNLLRQANGPMVFLESEPESFSHTGDSYVYVDRESFTTQLEQPAVAYNIKSEYRIEFPLERKRYKWPELFKLCNNYRKKKGLQKNEHIILLTNHDNDLNWFGGMDENANNYFVQTSSWGFFFGDDVDRRFPVAYEAASWILRRYMFPNSTAAWNGMHKDPVGCVMDYCQNKMQVVLKMRTGDVCTDCLEQIKKLDMSRTLANQILSVFENIRKFMTWKDRASFLRQPSRLNIKGHTKRLFLPDAGNLEVKLNPIERALYLVFLDHPEGILLSHFIDYKEALLKYYGGFSRQGNQNSITESVDRLLNPLDNNLNIALSRIRSKFREVVGEELACFYTIEGLRGEKYGVKLERELVAFED